MEESASSVISSVHKNPQLQPMRNMYRLNQGVSRSVDCPMLSSLLSGSTSLDTYPRIRLSLVTSELDERARENVRSSQSVWKKSSKCIY
jgi:hypothetical protein